MCVLYRRFGETCRQHLLQLLWYVATEVSNSSCCMFKVQKPHSEDRSSKFFENVGDKTTRCRNTLHFQFLTASVLILTVSCSRHGLEGLGFEFL